jgi:hypothetical protein
MRASTAYFVGAGTIVAAIAIGLGGGIVAGNIMNPVSPKQGADTTKMERRAETPAGSNAPTERVQYLTGSQVFGAVAVAPAAATPAAQDETQGTTANAVPASTQPTAAATEPKSEVKPEANPAATPSEQQASADPASSPDNAYAKAKDADLKRAAAERRRAERHQRWAERRRNHEQRDARESRGGTDWDDVARSVREDSYARDYATSRRSSYPQFRMFGGDDN